MCGVWCVEAIGLKFSYKSVFTELVLTRVLTEHIALCVVPIKLQMCMVCMGIPCSTVPWLLANTFSHTFGM